METLHRRLPSPLVDERRFLPMMYVINRNPCMRATPSSSREKGNIDSPSTPPASLSCRSGEGNFSRTRGNERSSRETLISKRVYLSSRLSRGSFDRFPVTTSRRMTRRCLFFPDLVCFVRVNSPNARSYRERETEKEKKGELLGNNLSLFVNYSTMYLSEVLF